MFRSLLTTALLLACAAPLAAQDAVLLPPSAAPIACEVPAAERIWASVDYLLWWLRPDHAPVPLATSGPSGAPRAGALGQPATTVRLGPDLDYGLHSGARLALGTWFDSGFGLELSGFVLETHTIHERAKSNAAGDPLIARPFLNLLTGQQDAQIVTAPADSLGGRYLGGLNIFGDSRAWGGELNVCLNMATAPTGRWHLLGGVRYLGLKDQLQIDQASTVLAPGSIGFGGAPAPAPDIVSQRDYLETANHFLGGQCGVAGEFAWRRFSLSGAAKAGLGATFQHLETVARTQLWDPSGASTTLPGGLYVPSNQQPLDSADLGFFSEVDLRLAYRLRERWRISAGYSLLYWSDVARPADQVPAAIDPRRVPSSLSFNPAFAPQPLHSRSSGFWAQGLTLGLECRF